jgi:hypothetical protein
VRHLAAEIESERICALATFRITASGGSMSDAVSGLVRGEHARLIELAGLTAADLAGWLPQLTGTGEAAPANHYSLLASVQQTGEYLDGSYQDRALIESWNGSRWSIADNPQPGSVRDMLFGASALSPSDVWAVGDQKGRSGKFETLAEHWDGSGWTVIPTPDPGSNGNHLYAVDAVRSDDVWAAGMLLSADSTDQGLVEHWDGRKWSVVALPAPASADLVMLDGITATASQVWVAGEADSPEGGQPFVAGYPEWDVDDPAAACRPRRRQLDQPVGYPAIGRQRVGSRDLRGPGNRQQQHAGATGNRRHLDG